MYIKFFSYDSCARPKPIGGPRRLPSLPMPKAGSAHSPLPILLSVRRISTKKNHLLCRQCSELALLLTVRPRESQHGICWADGQAGRTWRYVLQRAASDTRARRHYGRRWELHACYEERLGAAMSHPLGSCLLRLYASAASKLLPLPPSQKREHVADLEQDPFISSALQSACCELYHSCGI